MPVATLATQAAHIAAAGASILELSVTVMKTLQMLQDASDVSEETVDESIRNAQVSLNRTRALAEEMTRNAARIVEADTTRVVAETQAATNRIRR